MIHSVVSDKKKVCGGGGTWEVFTIVQERKWELFTELERLTFRRDPFRGTITSYTTVSLQNNVREDLRVQDQSESNLEKTSVTKIC